MCVCVSECMQMWAEQSDWGEAVSKSRSGKVTRTTQ